MKKYKSKIDQLIEQLNTTFDDMLQSLFGVNIEEELITAMSEEIRKEIDERILYNI